jgi:hypothetical protein
MRQQLADRPRPGRGAETVFLLGYFFGNGDCILANDSTTFSEILGSVVIQAVLLDRNTGRFLGQREKMLARWLNPWRGV